MGNIYSSSKTAFQNLIKENKDNKSFIPILLALLTIPLSNAINNVALALFVVVTIVTFRKNNIAAQTSLWYPIGLFAIMALSYSWSIDRSSTLTALLKEIPLLLLPFGFMVAKNLSKEQQHKIISWYSYSIVVLAFYYLSRAIIRYALTQDSRAFFYHGQNDDDYGLVPKLLNAIHVSVFVAVAFFYFVANTAKSKINIILAMILFGFILLLSSKNIIVIVLLLLLLYVFFFSNSAHRMRLRNLIVFGLLLGIIFSMGKIKQRFQEEFKNNTSKSLSTNVLDGASDGVHYVSIKEAWSNPSFTANDYFPGTAFRVYQLRVFIELLQEEPIFWTGYGLNASKEKLLEKEKKYNLHQGYGSFNFHNQYIQNFAELGVFGFIVLIIMLFLNVKNAYNSKDFVHFAFAILMISLFLTESFLWRQRGVVFFTLMYCLFNSGISPRYSKAE